MHQSFQHHCGYEGNAYHDVGANWTKITSCPQCKEVIDWVALSQQYHQAMLEKLKTKENE